MLQLIGTGEVMKQVLKLLRALAAGGEEDRLYGRLDAYLDTQLCSYVRMKVDMNVKKQSLH